MELIQKEISKLSPISLKEMDGVKLMNRTDTKFVFNKNLLPEILEQCQDHYRVLEINGERIPHYKTLYFDTEHFSLFRDHHNGRPRRYKVRIRNYVESKLFFLEAKLKVKGRTVKSRIKLPDFEEELNRDAEEFIRSKTGDDVSLVPSLWNSFRRITLVSRNGKERLTIDLGLGFESKGKKKNLDEIVIAEVKQENFDRNSPVISILRSKGVRPSGVSKYCIGAVLLFPGIKYNNFKEKLLLLERIKNVA